MARKKRRLALSKTKKKNKKLSAKKQADSSESTPNITNDTVAEHREQILSGAKRLTYPLQQSRHKIVIISVIIITLVIISSFVFSVLSLYRYKSTNNFAYRVSQVVPFPIAKVNGEYVSYEDYLFEIRHTLFYFRNHGQEGIDIDSEAGQDLEIRVKQEAFEKIKTDALALQIARENNISVSNDEVDAQIERIREQGGVGESDRALEDVLKDFYDWTVNDLRRTVRLQLVRQKIPAAIDTATIARADKALAELNSGRSFEKVAAKYSDDTQTKDDGGLIGFISRSTTDLPVEVVEEAFKLKKGEISGVVASPFGLDIIQVGEKKDGRVEVAHIFFEYFDVEEFLAEQLAQADVTDYVTFGKPEIQE